MEHFLKIFSIDHARGHTNESKNSIFKTFFIQHRVRARWKGMDQDKVFQHFKNISNDHARGHAHNYKIIPTVYIGVPPLLDGILVDQL